MNDDDVIIKCSIPNRNVLTIQPTEKDEVISKLYHFQRDFVTKVLIASLCQNQFI